MNVGGKGQKADINVTPMIDVLLVLIIIFLVITPTDPYGLKAQVPQQSADPVQSSQAEREIVITIAKDGRVAINRQPVDAPLLAGRLANLRGISDHIFIRGDRRLEFETVARVIDVARGAGWDRIGLMTAAD